MPVRSTRKPKLSGILTAAAFAAVATLALV
jgi:hypothetical protein